MRPKKRETLHRLNPKKKTMSRYLNAPDSEYRLLTAIFQQAHRDATGRLVNVPRAKRQTVRAEARAFLAECSEPFADWATADADIPRLQFHRR